MREREREKESGYVTGIQAKNIAQQVEARQRERERERKKREVDREREREIWSG